jgi:hypothetical protein
VGVVVLLIHLEAQAVAAEQAAFAPAQGFPLPLEPTTPSQLAVAALAQGPHQPRKGRLEAILFFQPLLPPEVVAVELGQSPARLELVAAPVVALREVVLPALEMFHR